MTDFSEQLRERLGMRRPATAHNSPGRLSAAQAVMDTPITLNEPEVPQPEQQLFVFDQYDGSSLGFYAEIEASSLGEAQALLKDMLSEQELIKVNLGVVKGKTILGRITFHPTGVRPTYFRRRRS